MMIHVTVEWNKSGRKRRKNLFVEYSHCVGNISVGLSHVKCGFAPGACSHAKAAIVGTLSSSLLGYLPGTPMCISVYACVRSLALSSVQISITIVIVHRRWAQQAQPCALGLRGHGLRWWWWRGRMNHFRKTPLLAFFAFAATAS
jgi:hypothetical protein